MRLLKSHPLAKLLNSYLIDAPQPSNISYMWNFGSLLAVCLGIQIITGVTLAMHFTPSIADAFNSVEHIMRDVNNGWLVRYLHSNTASAFFFLVFLHIGRGMYYGSYRNPRALVWIIGTIIFIAMIAILTANFVIDISILNLNFIIIFLINSFFSYICCSIYIESINNSIKINSLYILYYIIVNSKNNGIIVTLETLFKNLSFILIPNFWNFMNVLIIAYLFRTGVFTGDFIILNVYISNILFSYMSFIIIIYLINVLILYKPLNNNWLFFYNILLIFLTFILICILLYTCYNINELILNFIGILSKKLFDFVIKVMTYGGSKFTPINPRKPTGEGNQPPQKPEGPQSPKSSYINKDDKPKKRKKVCYSDLTPEKLKEHKQNQTDKKNTKRRAKYARFSEEEKVKFQDNVKESREKLKNSLTDLEYSNKKIKYKENRNNYHAKNKEKINARRREKYLKKKTD